MWSVTSKAFVPSWSSANTVFLKTSLHTDVRDLWCDLFLNKKIMVSHSLHVKMDLQLLSYMFMHWIFLISFT